MAIGEEQMEREGWRERAVENARVEALAQCRKPILGLKPKAMVAMDPKGVTGEAVDAIADLARSVAADVVMADKRLEPFEGQERGPQCGGSGSGVMTNRCQCGAPSAEYSKLRTCQRNRGRA